MVDPLPEDSAIVLRFIKSHSDIKAMYLMMETGFSHDRTIDAVRVLVERRLVNVEFPDKNPAIFQECRFYPKV